MSAFARRIEMTRKRCPFGVSGKTTHQARPGNAMSARERHDRGLGTPRHKSRLKLGGLALGISVAFPGEY